MRVFLDTNVIISAYFWHGKERKLLWECILGKYEGFISDYVPDGVRKVLIEKFGLPEESVERYISLIIHFLGRVKVENGPDVSSDLGDNPIVWACVNALVDVPVTGDRDIPSLREDKKEFCTGRHCFKILRAGEI